MFVKTTDTPQMLHACFASFEEEWGIFSLMTHIAKAVDSVEIKSRLSEISGKYQAIIVIT